MEVTVRYSGADYGETTISERSSPIIPQANSPPCIGLADLVQHIFVRDQLIQLQSAGEIPFKKIGEISSVADVAAAAVLHGFLLAGDKGSRLVPKHIIITNLTLLARLSVVNISLLLLRR